MGTNNKAASAASTVWKTFRFIGISVSFVLAAGLVWVALVLHSNADAGTLPVEAYSTQPTTTPTATSSRSIDSAPQPTGVALSEGGVSITLPEGWTIKSEHGISAAHRGGQSVFMLDMSVMGEEIPTPKCRSGKSEEGDFTPADSAMVGSEAAIYRERTLCADGSEIQRTWTLTAANVLVFTTGDIPSVDAWLASATIG